MYGAALTPASQLPGLVAEVRSLLDNPKAPFGFNLFCPPAHIPAHTAQQQQALETVHQVYADLAGQHGLACDVQLLPAPDVAQLQAAFTAQVEVGGWFGRTAVTYCVWHCVFFMPKRKAGVGTLVEQF